MEDAVEMLRESYRNILVAMEQRRFLDVVKLMEQRTEDIARRMPYRSQNEIEEIQYQTLQLQSHILRLTLDLEDVLRRTVEVAPALRAYGSHRTLPRADLEDEFRGKE